MTHKPRSRPVAMPIDYDLGPGTWRAKADAVRGILAGFSSSRSEE